MLQKIRRVCVCVKSFTQLHSKMLMVSLSSFSLRSRTDSFDAEACPIINSTIFHIIRTNLSIGFFSEKAVLAEEIVVQHLRCCATDQKVMNLNPSITKLPRLGP